MRSPPFASPVGGGAGGPLTNMNFSPKGVQLWNQKHDGTIGSAPTASNSQDARRLIRMDLRGSLPVAVAVRWEKGNKNGNHWVYLVGHSGSKIHVRDQQNGHVLGTSNTSDWMGSTIDGKYTYTVTKMVIGQRRN